MDPFEEDFEELREVPQAFHLLSSKITNTLLTQLNDDDFSAMTIDPVASPVLQMLMLVQEKNSVVLDQIMQRFFTSANNSTVTIDGDSAKMGADAEG